MFIKEGGAVLNADSEVKAARSGLHHFQGGIRTLEAAY